MSGMPRNCGWQLTAGSAHPRRISSIPSQRRTSTIHSTSWNMTAMETAPQPEASGLEGDYRILADFNGTVLAGTHSKHGVQFVTWDWDYDRTDVALRWRNTGAAEKWDRKKQSFRRNPFLASFDYFIFRQRCVIL